MKDTFSNIFRTCITMPADGWESALLSIIASDVNKTAEGISS